ncbi:MAG: LPD23 domain-containing protein [Pseudomonadota bacterium]|nr:LPD23 domain-containing protein [Pseudomonadota bacterium]
MVYRNHALLIDHLNRGLLQPFEFSEIEIHKATSASEVALSRLAKHYFDKNVLFFSNHAPDKFLFDGAALIGTDLIFINRNSALPLHVVFGHELLHHIKHDAENLYQQFSSSVLNEFKQTEAYAVWEENKLPFLPQETESDLEEELLADFVGNQLPRTEFWQTLAEKNLDLSKSTLTYSSTFFNRFFRPEETPGTLFPEMQKEFNALKGAITHANKLILQYSKQAQEDSTYKQFANELEMRLKLMYMGESSVLADQEKLALAKAMLKSGAPENDVRIQTGWLKGLDLKFRYEITDESAIFFDPESLKAEIPLLKQYIEDTYQEFQAGNLTKKQASQTFTKIEARQLLLKDISKEASKTLNDRLGALFYHPELYASYPQLRHIKVRFSNEMSPESLGFAYIKNSPRDSSIYLNSSELFKRKQPLKEIAYIILHEVQHIVQFIEGFSQGSSVEDNLAWANNILKKRSVESVERLKVKWQASKSETDWSHYKEALASHQDQRYLTDLHAKAYSLYSRHYGEVEANDTKNRAELNDKQRLQIPPLTLTATEGLNLIVETEQGQFSAPPNLQQHEVLAVIRSNSNSFQETMQQPSKQKTQSLSAPPRQKI